ncbi:MAG: alpha/beta fold hydrolase [Syntrophaceae bacterium]|nr:alpha/beta fold hydrolase [Syntrophaceae bacterium]
MIDVANEADGLSILSSLEIEELEKNVQFQETRQGTRLAFHEYGDPRGSPIIFYHGTGSHVHGMLLHKPGLKCGFRIIAPDRPGVAQSDFRPGWTVLEYARDMADLADHLGIGSFGAIGISGGGPTLMASAFAIPDRLHCVVDLACAMPVYDVPEMAKYLGTMDRFYAKLGTRLPLALFKIPFSFLGMMQRIMKSPKSFAKMFDSSLCPSDKEIFRLPDFQYLFMRDFQELYRLGSKGPAYDAQTVYKRWGFNVSDIEIHIEVFHGASDKFVPPKFSEYLAKNAKNVRLNLLEGQGHFYHLAYGYQMLKKVAELFYAGKDHRVQNEP